MAAGRLVATGWWRATLVGALFAAAPHAVSAAGRATGFALGVEFRLTLGAGAAPTLRLHLERARFDPTRRHELAALELTPGPGIVLRLADRVRWDVGARAFVAAGH